MTDDPETRVHDDEWTDEPEPAEGVTLTDDRELDDDPFEDPFDDQAEPADEPSPRRRRAVPPVAIGLIGVVVAGAGFIAGVQVQKRSGDDATGGLPAGMAAMMQAGGPGGGSGAESARGDATDGGTTSTTGEVANVKGSRVYVTTADGSTVEVSVGKAGAVQRLAGADVDEIRPGDTIVVTGTTRSDGSVKADAVQATADGVSQIGGGRGGGPSAGGSGAAAPAGSGAPDASGAGAADAAPSDDGAAVDQLFESGD